MKKETLKNYYNKLNFKEFTDFDLKGIETFPASQGYLLIELIKRYKIPFKELGYYQNIVSIKTKKQAMIWKDTGIGATFLGIIDLESGDTTLKSDETPTDNKVFPSFKELNAEITKRDYNNIKGLSAKITQEDYFNALEALPPLKMGNHWFILSEALTDGLYYKFSHNTSYLVEVVELEEEEIIILETAR